MNLLAIKPDTLVKRDEALNENFSAINEKVEATARTADAGLEAAFDAQQKASNVEVDLIAHVSDKNNPHNVTVEQLGLANAYVYRGSVANYSALPSSPATGDVYNIVNSDDEHNICAGDNVAWNGEVWDNLSGVFDTSALESLISANAEAIAENAKTLTAHGTTLAQLQATVNDIEIQVGASVGIDDATASGSSTYSSQKIESLVGGAVLYTPQSLTDEQKTQVKANIGIEEPDVSSLIPKTGNRGVLNGWQAIEMVELLPEDPEYVAVSGVEYDGSSYEQPSWVMTLSEVPDHVRVSVDNGSVSGLVLKIDTDRRAASSKSWIKVIDLDRVPSVLICEPLANNSSETWTWVNQEQLYEGAVEKVSLVVFWNGYQAVVSVIRGEPEQ